MIAMAAPRAEELAALLVEEARFYADLLELAPRERAAVVANDASLLNEVVAEKDRILASIARAEIARQAWIGAWAATRGVAAAGVTLTSLLRDLPPADAAAIGPLRDLLLSRIRDVAQMNHDNGQLVQGALRIVSNTLDAYSRVRQDLGYQPTGQRATAGQSAGLDYRA